MKSAVSRVTVEFTDKAILLTFNDERISEEHQVKDIEASILPVLDQAKEKTVVLDLAAVRFVSTIFLALLIRIHKRICELDGRMELSNLHSSTHKILEVTNLTKIFTISPPV